MGIDINNGYSELLWHFGHKIVIAKYVDENVAIECETCNCVLFDFDREHTVEEQRFGEMAWRVGDITSRTDLTDEQASEWLANNQKYLRDQLVAIGNEDVLPTLLRESGIDVNDEE